MSEVSPPRPRLLLGSLVALFVFAVIELGSWAAIHLLSGRLDEPIRRTRFILAEQQRWMRQIIDSNGVALVELDTLLGWHYRPGYRRGVHVISPQGFRGEKLYQTKPPAGVLRIAAYGDSFVYGTEVEPTQSWPAHAERLFPVEVLNNGVGGFGVDQALLRYARDGQALPASVVVIGFSEDDLSRVVNVYRRFRSSSEHPLGKPRFTLHDGELRLLPTRLGHPDGYAPYLRDPWRIRELGANDYWYSRLLYENPVRDWSATARLLSATVIRLQRRYLNVDRLMDGHSFRPASEAFAIQQRLFLAFADSVKAHGSVPIVLFIPSYPSVERTRAAGSAAYKPLMDSVCGRVTCMDAAIPLSASRAAPEQLYMPGGHLSSRGNEMVAGWLIPQLQHMARQPAAAAPTAAR
jgi:hypothetical protein